MEGLLGSRHPNSLDDLEHGRSNHHKDKEGLEVNINYRWSVQFNRWDYLELTISSGLTGYLSSVLEVLTTFPLLVTFLAFFSLAFLICGVLGILEQRVVLVSVGVSFLNNKDLLAVMCSSAAAMLDLLLDGVPTLQTARSVPQNYKMLPAYFMFSNIAQPCLSI